MTRIYFSRLAAGIIMLCCPSVLWGAIGIYNWSMVAPTGAPPVQINYRLNHSGDVRIEILDQAEHIVCTLGPYSETAGLHSHEWNGMGASAGSERYRARIVAANAGIGASGTLQNLFSYSNPNTYGMTIDRFSSSPGYGTIYASDVSAGGKLYAYYADGSPKLGFGGDPTNNVLKLGFNCAFAMAPWGIGVDRSGNIHTACFGYGVSGYMGVRVFNSEGTLLYHVSPTLAQGNIWLDGLLGPRGLEIYETKGAKVRACSATDGFWNEVAMDPGISGTNVTAQQICFETSGTACYVAISGGSSNPTNPNPGIMRFNRQADGNWTRDMAFDCGLTGLIAYYPAAMYCVGVSCDARDPDGPGPYSTSALWIGLNCNPNSTYSNIIRKDLSSGQLMSFPAIATRARYLAADAIGNVAIELGAPLTTDKRSLGWGMYVPGGEPSTDTRLTDWINIAGAASRQVADNITNLLALPNDTLVELGTGKKVSAAYNGYFYLQEPDRTGGIRVECTSPVAEGDIVRVLGKLATERGERVLKDGQLIAP